MEFDITSKGELTTLKERQNILRDYAEKVAKGEANICLENIYNMITFAAKVLFD